MGRFALFFALSGVLVALVNSQLFGGNTGTTDTGMQGFNPWLLWMTLSRRDGNILPYLMFSGLFGSGGGTSGGFSPFTYYLFRGLMGNT